MMSRRDEATMGRRRTSGRREADGNLNVPCEKYIYRFGRILTPETMGIERKNVASNSTIASEWPYGIAGQGRFSLANSTKKRPTELLPQAVAQCRSFLRSILKHRTWKLSWKAVGKKKNINTSILGLCGVHGCQCAFNFKTLALNHEAEETRRT